VCSAVRTFAYKGSHRVVNAQVGRRCGKIWSLLTTRKWRKVAYHIVPMCGRTEEVTGRRCTHGSSAFAAKSGQLSSRRQLTTDECRLTRTRISKQIRRCSLEYLDHTGSDRLHLWCQWRCSHSSACFCPDPLKKPFAPGLETDPRLPAVGL
jgi:hypothetical protein